ncbi:UNVERIFIED_CONTAM: redox-regulated ATPase YchF, partial [Salmonella enterica subsp. enterica serovar Weltevreden]
SFITAKPALYIANVDEAGLQNGNDYLKRVQEYAAKEGSEVVPVCAAIEAQTAPLDHAATQAFLADLGQEEAGLDRVTRGAYHLLGL